jgi:hypothetical protein
MGWLSLLVQIAGVCSGAYILFTESFAKGIALIAIVWLGHLVFTKLSSYLMLAHQRTMSEDELQELQVRALFGAAAVPAAWARITKICGLLYFGLVIASIWLLVTE